MENELSQVANVAPPVENNTPTEEMALPRASEQPKPAGLLFDSIGYRTQADIPKFIETMGINEAAMVILSVVGFAHKKGIFSLIESEVASKAVRVFTAPPPMMGTPPEEKIEQPTS